MRRRIGWRTCWLVMVWVRASGWRCWCRVRARRLWRFWRCSRPGRLMCRLIRRCRRRGWSSWWAMPLRWRCSPPRSCVRGSMVIDLLVVESTIRRVSVQPSTGLPAPAAEDIAYLIYTSGTTGVPKGVAVTALQCHPAVGVAGCRRAGRGGVDAVPLVGLRFLGVGGLRGAAWWRAAGGGARRGGAAPRKTYMRCWSPSRSAC